MLNPFHDVDWNPDTAARRKFAHSLVIGFPAIALFFSLVTWWSHGAPQPFFFWLAVIGCAAGLLFWFLPQIARPFYLAWYFIACCMGFVIGNVLFATFYYAVFVPIGLLLRVAGYAPYARTFDRRQATYWRTTEKVVDLQRYYRQF